MRFSDFALSEPILAAVAAEGYDTPTPIQMEAIPPILEGRDLLGCAQTGTGKTAAFALPILENLSKQPAQRGRRTLKVLVLSPTRELASQIADSFGAYGRGTGLRHTVIFGGVNQNRQIDAMERGVDILVATPGRLLDLMGQGEVSLSDIEVFVLDEADRMLDMGFVHDVKKIAAVVPKQRQTLLFSATMPDSIRALAASLLHKPVEVAVTPVASTAETVSQEIYFVEKADKRALLSWVLDRENIDRAIVFTRTKHGANRVAEYLEKRGVNSAAIHGNKSQNARERALEGFKQGRIRALIATDIAARGIDIDELSFVINFDLPNVPEAYVHRIGRTGRAGASGRALSFCEQEERPYLVDIERLIQQHVPVVSEHPYPSPLGLPRPTDLTPRHQRGGARPAPQAQRSSGGSRPAHGHERPAHHANRPGQGGPRPHGAPKPAQASVREARDPAPRRDTRDQAPRRDSRDAPRDTRPRQDSQDRPQRQETRDQPRREVRDQPREYRDQAPRRDGRDQPRQASRDAAPQRDSAARRDPAPARDSRGSSTRRDGRDDPAQKAARSTFTGGVGRS